MIRRLGSKGVPFAASRVQHSFPSLNANCTHIVSKIDYSDKYRLETILSTVNVTEVLTLGMDHSKDSACEARQIRKPKENQMLPLASFCTSGLASSRPLLSSSHPP